MFPEQAIRYHVATLLDLWISSRLIAELTNIAGGLVCEKVGVGSMKT
jgi:hypothetical protein